MLVKRRARTEHSTTRKRDTCRVQIVSPIREIVTTYMYTTLRMVYLIPLKVYVIVMESVLKGERVASEFIASLSYVFHTIKSRPIQTIFLRLLTIGQLRQIELSGIFQSEICPEPPSLIDEYGCLGKVH